MFGDFGETSCKWKLSSCPEMNDIIWDCSVCVSCWEGGGSFTAMFYFYQIVFTTSFSVPTFAPTDRVHTNDRRSLYLSLLHRLFCFGFQIFDFISIWNKRRLYEIKICFSLFFVTFAFLLWMWFDIKGGLDSGGMMWPVQSYKEPYRMIYRRKSKCSTRSWICIQLA